MEKYIPKIGNFFRRTSEKKVTSINYISHSFSAPKMCQLQTPVSITRQFHTRVTLLQPETRQFHTNPSVPHKFVRQICQTKCWSDGFLMNWSVNLTDFWAEKEWHLCGTDVLNWQVSGTEGYNKYIKVTYFFTPNKANIRPFLTNPSERLRPTPGTPDISKVVKNEPNLTLAQPSFSIIEGARNNHDDEFDDDFGTQFFATVDLTKTSQDIGI